MGQCCGEVEDLGVFARATWVKARISTLRGISLFCSPIARSPWSESRVIPGISPSSGSLAVALPAGVLLAVWLGTGLTAKRWLPRRAHYIFHLLYWFGPVVLLQWLLAGPLLLNNLALVILPTGVVGSWLSFADYLAVGEKIWFFDPAQILGWSWRGRLPIEEIIFFYLTSLLVAQSYVMLVPVFNR